MSAAASPHAKGASTRLARTFERLAASGHKALIPYLCAGDPHASTTVALMHALAASGADVIELGVPFSDPSADGPVIQQAAERALAGGTTLAGVLLMVAQFRERNRDTPVVLMGYANPIERYEQRAGAGRFAQDAQRAGVDGVLVVDYPPEAEGVFFAGLRAAQIDPIFLLAPTSTDTRIAAVAAQATGYVYYVSLAGVTGAAHLSVDAVAHAMARLRQQVRVPVGVGFGIRDAASARAVAAHADGVVIGSALVQLVAQQSRDNAPAAAAAFMADVRAALDAA